MLEPARKALLSHEFPGKPERAGTWVVYRRPLRHYPIPGRDCAAPPDKLKNRVTRNLGTLTSRSARWVGSPEPSRQASLLYRYPRWPGGSPTLSQSFSGLVRL